VGSSWLAGSVVFGVLVLVGNGNPLSTVGVRVRRMPASVVWRGVMISQEAAGMGT
jgi:hypothetical protein